MNRRLPLLSPDRLDDAQRALYDSIQGGPRGKVRLTDEDGCLVGPFNAWLYSPSLGKRISQLGEGVRFESSLPTKLTEIAILVMARHWRAQFEGWAHERLASRAGVAPETIAALRAGERPSFDDSDDKLVYDFAKELLDTRRVSDDLYRRAVERFGEGGVVELVTLLGYYALVSMTLNVFAVPLPPGHEEPYGD